MCCLVVKSSIPVEPTTSTSWLSVMYTWDGLTAVGNVATVVTVPLPEPALPDVLDPEGPEPLPVLELELPEPAAELTAGFPRSAGAL